MRIDISKKFRNKSLYIIYSIFIITILSLTINFIKNYNVSAENVEYNVNIASALTVTVTSGGEATSNLVLNLNPMNHTFDSNSIDVTVATNNVTGYNLAMSTVNGSTDLVRNQDPSSTGTNDGVSAVLSTLVNNATSTGYSEAEFRNCNTSDCTNKWGFKVSSSDTDSNKVTSNYFPFASDPSLAVNHYATNGDTTTLDFAAKIDWNQPAGTYENTLVFTATATYAAYDIKYYDGVDNAEESYIAHQTNSYNTSSNVKLDPTYKDTADTTTIADPDTGNTITIPARNTYDFIKWCDTIPGADSNNYFPATTCSGNSYNTGDTITINPEDYNTNIKLYAYWDPTTFEEAYEKIAEQTGDSSITTKVTGKTSTNQDITAYQMQKMSKDICAATTINEVTQLIDSRSGNYAYYVAKLKDDKCWMTQNLRLGTKETVASPNITLTTNDSNVSATTTINNKLAAPGKIPSNNSKKITDNRTGSDAYVYDGWVYYCTPVSGDTNQYVGCYYNWYTATAGTGKEATPAQETDASASICPKNWNLPSSGTDGDYQILYKKYPSLDLMMTPDKYATDNTTGLPRPGFVYAGSYVAGGGYYTKERATYWSRTAYSTGYARVAHFVLAEVNVNVFDNKYNASSIRCLAYGS